MSFEDSDLDVDRLRRGEYERSLLAAGVSPERVSFFGYNRLNLEGRLYRPVVDEAHLDRGGDQPEWPGDAPFAVCLTHDVDMVSKYPTRRLFKHGLRHLWATPNTDDPRRALRTATRSVLRGLESVRHRGPDPFHRYERWLDIEDDFDAHSTFFFLPDGTRRPHHSDHTYRYSDPVRFDGQERTVAGMIRKIDDCGWEVGLHASWHAYDDPATLRRERGQLEDCLGHEIESVRQHWLHYDLRETPRAHERAGFAYDSSIGLKGNVGFRLGTSYPVRLRDFDRDRPLSVLEVPLVAIDGSLLKAKNMDLTPEMAFRYLKRLAKSVKRVGGVLTLLWHPSNVNREEWLDLYRRTLKYLASEGAWFGSVSEVGEWWQTHNDALLDFP